MAKICHGSLMNYCSEGVCIHPKIVYKCLVIGSKTWSVIRWICVYHSSKPIRFLTVWHELCFTSPWLAVMQHCGWLLLKPVQRKAKQNVAHQEKPLVSFLYYSFNIKMLSIPETVAIPVNLFSNSHCLRLVVVSFSWSHSGFFKAIFSSSLTSYLYP